MIFPNRLVLSAMAGINNADFAKKHKVGFAILGGFNADKATNEAAIRAMKRGRKEFVFKDPLKGIESELKKMEEFKGVIGVNIRSSTMEGYLAVAKLAGDFDAVIEINAHCRQEEFIKIGCGQALLLSEKLPRIVEEASKFTEVSVKIRGGLNVDYEKIARKLFDSGALLLHVDAMIPGGGADYNLVERLSRIGNVIGNNSVTDVRSARKMIEHGAKLVSAARAVLRDPLFFEKLLEDDLLSTKVEVI
uniref:Hydrolase n=1 Tax=Geoglobus ahangari TaxID=113653 RepID=A0A7C3YEM3_9EURY